MRHLTIIFCLMSIAFLSSCDDFLDKQPLDELSQNTFFKSKQDVEQGLISTYLKFRSPVIG